MIEDVDLDNRVIALIDMDCFEAQIYQKDYPHLKGKPCVVANSGGRIVSVNYEARKFGISRALKVYQAERKCKKLNVLQIPMRYGKPDNSKLRHASQQVLDAIKTYIKNRNADQVVLEYSPNDEFYLDLTRQVDSELENNYRYFYYWAKTFLDTVTPLILLLAIILPPESVIMSRVLTLLAILYEFSQRKLTMTKMRLACGASFVANVCAEIKRSTKMSASGGISCNKFRAKLTSSENKPNGISILARDRFKEMILSQKIRAVPGLKGDLGEKICKLFGIVGMKELAKLGKTTISRKLEYDEVEKIFNILHGIDSSPVVAKEFSGAIHCCKTVFTPGKKMSAGWWDWIYKLLGGVIGSILTRLGLIPDSFQFRGKSRKNLDKLIRDRCTEMLERLGEEKQRNGRTAINLQVEISYLTNRDDPKTLERHVRTFMPKWTDGVRGIAREALNQIRTKTSFSEDTMQITEIGITAKNWVYI